MISASSGIQAQHSNNQVISYSGYYLLKLWMILASSGSQAIGN